MARMMLEASEGAAASGGAERAEGVLADTVVAAASAVDTAFDPVAYINTPRWQHSVLGLERVEELLDRLGRPQDRLRFIHVAGTNGKGSISAYLATSLEEAGYTVGLFTSPYIRCFEERIRVNGQNIQPNELLRATYAVRNAAEAMEAQGLGHPTEFELMLAVALVHFVARGCELVVLEVGLGGRLDATNVISAPEVAVIARIGLDHTDLLGTTQTEIAEEKAGIIKAGTTVVSWPQDPEAQAIINARCEEQGCPLRIPDFAVLTIQPLECERSGEELQCYRRFSYQDTPYRTTLLGWYQPFNAVVALEALEVLRQKGWSIPVAAVQAGLEKTRWPGRFELVDSTPVTLFDGGHNPQGAAALVESLEELSQCLEQHGIPGGRHGSRERILVFGVLADKDWRTMVSLLAPPFQRVICFTPPNPRALAAESLAQGFQEECEAAGLDLLIECAASEEEALLRAWQQAGEEGLVVLAGSLYSLGVGYEVHKKYRSL